MPAFFVVENLKHVLCERHGGGLRAFLRMAKPAACGRPCEAQPAPQLKGANAIPIGDSGIRVPHRVVSPFAQSICSEACSLLELSLCYSHHGKTFCSVHMSNREFLAA